nr:DUF294 nucleotidyltransferase-like domain-containing protein [Vibrio galatheae]
MRVCNGLAACSFPLCDGKCMAANPKWCQPVQCWKDYYQKWLANTEYDKLVSISAFLEVRAIHGNREFVDQIQQYLHHCIQKSPRFISALKSSTLTMASLLNLSQPKSTA